MKARINKQLTYTWNYAYSSDSSDLQWKLQTIIDYTWNKFVSWNPLWKDKIVLDPEDSWSADLTIAKIAVPVLKQLKKTKHGYGLIDDSDVPDYLKSHNDEHCEKKYEWVLDEIIWSLTERANNEENAPDLPDSFPLFDECPDGSSGGFSWKRREYSKEEQQIYDEFIEKTTEYENRIQNGCRLFGTYFQTLWD